MIPAFTLPNLTSYVTLGRGCGAVGRAVASDTRDPRFESRHRQYFEHIYLSIAIQKRRK